MSPDASVTGGPRLEVPSLAVALGDRFRTAGYQLYLVGGAVRELLMGHSSRGEFDFATDARPEETVRILQGWAEWRKLVGIRFGTVGAGKDGKVFEITTFRKEMYPADDRHPVVTFGDRIEEDLSRRDFTINAMAIRLPEGEFIDPSGGVRDLAAKLIDTPLDPAISFGDDPLRMLRAARFTSALELVPTRRVVEAMKGMADRLEIVSAERIRDELSRMLLTEQPSRGLELLVATGLADRFIPELPALRLQQDPVHRHKDVLKHTFAVVEKVQEAGEEPNLRLRLAALLHDIGKPATRQITPEGVQFHHHEVVGARMAEERLRALRYPNEVIADVVKLVEMHLRFHSYRLGWSDSAVRRYVREAGPLLDDLNRLVRADCTTRNKEKAKALQALQDDLELRIARLSEQENLEQLRPPLDGNQVMEHLDVPPGPLVGKALEYLMEQRLDRGPISEEEAFSLLDEWWRQENDRR